MALYPRSDVMLVAASPKEGCGAVHARPVTHGVPVRKWRLDCPQCHAALKDDPLFAGTEQDIPETPDEKKIREDAEKKSSVETQQDVARAFTELSAAATGNKDVLAKLTEVMAMLAAQMPQQKVISGSIEPPVAIEKTHRPQTYDYRECAECGEPIVRTKGQRGALPKRCADCAHKRAA